MHLTILAAIISVPAGLLLGVLTGALGGTRGSIWGRLLGGLSSSVPDFVFGAIVVYMASKIGWRVVGGAYVPFTDDPIASTARMVLPALALSFYAVGVLARTTRDSVLEVRTEPFISTAVAQGDTRLQIVRRHILRNVSNPAVAVTAVNVGYLVGGAVIIERVFALPGIGSYALDAVNARDYPVVLATVMLGTLAFVVANTVSDLLGGVLDPRLGAKRRLTN